MAGASLKVEWNSEDLKKVNKVFADLLAQTDNLEPLMRDIGEYLLPAHKDRIAQGITPDGVAFEPLSPDYVSSERKRKSRGADKILILDDFLRGDLAYQVDGNGLQLGTNVVYGATHQFGRTKGNIPARPFLGFSDADIDEIEAIAQDYLAEIMAI
ncbi:MAG: phage virion morphogenesis protein [Halioglobus sp.]